MKPRISCQKVREWAVLQLADQVTRGQKQDSYLIDFVNACNHYEENPNPATELWVVRAADRLNKTLDIIEPLDVFMVMVNETSGCVFVKALDFFKSQGGFTQTWGLRWVPILATDIEDARRRGCEVLPYAKPYEQQAKP